MKPTIIFIFCYFLLHTPTAVAQWTNNQDAEYVIGQADFTTYTSANGETGLYCPTAVVIDLAHNKMYVADESNHRILRFSYPVSANQPSAELVFGQTDFTSYGNGCTASTLSSPEGLAVYNGDLWVADIGNNRVLKFSRADTISSNGRSADVVLGQSSFTVNDSLTTQSGMYAPGDVFIDGSERLWVADYNNHRVLRFDNASTKTSGADADGVLGQTLYTTKTPRTTQNGMKMPNCVWVSDTTLWVSDSENHRVLRFDNAVAKLNGSNADGVLGQPDFISGSADTTQGGFNVPYGICVDGSGRLYVADYENNRVLIFDTASGKGNGANADNILGQSDYITSTYQQGKNGFWGPTDIIVDNSNNKLLVCDVAGNRVLQFSSNSRLPVELTSFSAATSRSQAVLSWSTATETNCYGFDIERRTIDNQQWAKIGFAPGSGTSNSPNEYSFADSKLPAGRYEYRLKQIDNNGSFKYSQSVEIEIAAPKEFALEQNYPNPFNPTTTITYDIPNVGTRHAVSLRVYDILGKEVATLVNETKEAGSYDVTFNASQLASGVYFYNLTAGSFSVVKKLVLMK